MKLVDMYFWQIGYEKDLNPSSSNVTERTIPRRRSRSMYAEIIWRFMAQGARSVQVSAEGVGTATLRAGLRAEIRNCGADVKLVQRGEKTYLVRAEAG